MSGAPVCRPERFLARIARKVQDYRSSGSIVIVAFGDSVTMGCTALGEIEPSAVYHHRLKGMLEARHPQAVFSMINSGIGGDNTGDAIARLDRDVLRYRPDLVLVAFGLNDASSEPGRLELFRDNLRRIVRDVLAAASDAILLTPSFMCSRESSAVAAEHRGYLPHMLTTQNDGVLARFAQAVRDVAAEQGVALADVYAAWEALAKRGVDTTAMLANGLNHPTGAAHEIAAEQVMAAIEEKG